MNDKDALTAKLAEQPAETGGDGFMTCHEICREMGWNIRQTHDRLRELLEAGDLEVANVKRKNLAGRISTVPGYRLKRKD